MIFIVDESGQRRVDEYVGGLVHVGERLAVEPYLSVYVVENRGVITAMPHARLTVATNRGLIVAYHDSTVAVTCDKGRLTHVPKDRWVAVRIAEGGTGRIIEFQRPVDADTQATTASFCGWVATAGPAIEVCGLMLPGLGTPMYFVDGPPGAETGLIALRPDGSAGGHPPRDGDVFLLRGWHVAAAGNPAPFRFRGAESVAHAGTTYEPPPNCTVEIRGSVVYFDGQAALPPDVD